MKKLAIVCISIIIICITLVIVLPNDKKNEDENIKKEEKKEEVIIDYKVNYNQFVKVNKDSSIYDESKKKVGNISNGTIIELDSEYEIVDEYYKIKDTNYYINYLDVSPTEQEIFDNNAYKTYKNYIVYNENIITNNPYKIYLSDNTYLELNKEDNYPIIIKDDERYGIEFNNHLSYINKNDVKEVVGNNNTDLNHTNAVAVLNYHFTIDENSDEGRECLQSICMDQTQVEEEIKYLSDNNFYATTMEDFYLFVTGKVQLPEKSVLITIDDGWYVSRMKTILEKYQMMGTLFLIGWLASPDDYRSDYIEIHSHTWDMHTPGVCNGSHGGGILCLDENKVLEDLKKSRESLNNTEFFCYPFYEYNTRAIDLLKKAGFKMAFAGGGRKAKVGDDLYIIPRFPLSNSTSINTFINYVN